MVDQNFMSQLFEGVYVVDKSRRIVFWNEGSERITGYKADEVVNRFCYHNILQHVDQDGKELCFNGCPLHHTLETKAVNHGHVFLKHKEGYRVPVSVKTIPMLDNHGNIIGAIEIFTDERFQKNIIKENESLKDELMKDPLTQITNRRYFEYSLEQAIEQHKLFNKSFGILMFDIDHFKHINDTYGHLVGDEILKIVAKSLSSSIKKSDIISRWGGEEFIGLFEVDTVEDLKGVAERLRNLVNNSTFTTKEKSTISVTISIGGALFKANLKHNHLLDLADQALYLSKENGRNQTTIAN